MKLIWAAMWLFKYCDIFMPLKQKNLKTQRLRGQRSWGK